MKYQFLIVTFFLMIQASYAQEVLENNSPGIKWYQIQSPHFNILYPKGFEAQAQRMANTFEHIRVAESSSLGKSPRKFSVILQNQSSVSNGFVSILPRRSEFFTMPTQDYNFGGTNDWLNQLATHEFRHMVQYDNSRVGFNKLLYYMFGPATLAAMAQVSVPQWFWEGDAVTTETAFTHTGRGRVPNFNLLMRTNLQEGRTFNYHKQYLRSYKHNIPDHYVLGYNMVSYLRKRTGDPEIWGKITKRAWSVPFIPFAFSNAIKKESGLHVTDLYKAMVQDLQKTWSEQTATLSITPFEKLNQRKSAAYTNYSFPQILNDGSVLTIKSGIGDIEQFVVIKDGKENKIFTPGIINESGMLSASGTKVVWNEFGFDPRWRVKTYSLIKAYDVATKRYWIVTNHSRYAGAAISPDGSKIVTVESKNDYSVSLVVIDAESGSEVKRFTNPGNSFYSMARWSNDGKKIVALKTRNQERSVVVVDFETAHEAELIKPSRENIGHPVLIGNYLFYNSPVSGIDNIYVLDLQTQKRFQVTSSKYGAYNPSVSSDGLTIYYNDQSRDGLDVVSVPLHPSTWKEITSNQVKEYHAYIAEQEGRPTLFDSIPQKTFEAKKHSKLSGIINPYSWGAYFNSSFTQADMGINSQDILSTTSLKAGYLFDIYERTGAWQVGMSYQNWLPIIDINFKYAKRSINEGSIPFLNVNSNTNDTTLVYKNVTFDWTEKTVEAGIRIPLLTTKSKYYSEVNFSNYLGYTQVTDFKNTITNQRYIPVYIVDGVPSGNSVYPFFDYIGQGSLQYNHVGFSAYRLLKQSRRDIYSKFGQAVYLDYFSTPYGGDYKGNLFSVYTTVFFPGVAKHHSLWGYWAYQKTGVDVSLNDYIFRNNVPAPRGQSIYRFEKFYSMSVNYTMPIWYPDIAIGPILNIQRFRLNAFYDYGFGTKVLYYNIFNQTYASVGGELKMDINVLRFLPQFNVGVRYSYGLQPSVTKFEFLIGLVNF